jgi:subtilisin family serine protease
MRLGVWTAGGIAVLAAALALVPPASATSATLDDGTRSLAARLDSQLHLTAVEGRGRVRVVVEVRPNSGTTVRAAIARAGGRVELRYRRLVQAVVPASALDGLARDAAVRYVRRPLRPVADVTSEGVGASNATGWHAQGLTGAGARVAIIDEGFAGYLASQASGELPPGVVAREFREGCLNGSRHGTASAEVVHDMAPQAQLFLLCVDTDTELGSAEEFSKLQDVHVITHSLSWFNGSRGDGTAPDPTTPEGIANDARANGILWVNSAGNFAQRHWSGVFSDPDGDEWNNFTAADEGNGFTLEAGAEACVWLKWDDWPFAANDFNLFLWPGPAQGDNEPGVPLTVTALKDSIREQRVLPAPTEDLCYKNELNLSREVYVSFRRFAGTGSPRFDLFVNVSALEHQTPDGSVAEPATSPSVLAVGSYCWQNDAVQFYSSRGPNIAGRVKPDLVAPDPISSNVFGLFTGCNGPGGFRGTSAATPHVAGAAALVKQRHPGYGPDQLQQFLELNARDLGLPGKDNAAGAGKLFLPGTPVTPTPPPPPPSPPPPPPSTPPPGPTQAKLSVVRFVTSPKRASAGKRFTARIAVVRRDTGALVRPASIACSAAAGAAPLRPLARRSRLGYGECVWRVPARAKGRTLRGAIAVGYDGARVSRSFSRKIG